MNNDSQIADETNQILAEAQAISSEKERSYKTDKLLDNLDLVDEFDGIDEVVEKLGIGTNGTTNLNPDQVEKLLESDIDINELAMKIRPDIVAYNLDLFLEFGVNADNLKGIAAKIGYDKIFDEATNKYANEN